MGTSVRIKRLCLPIANFGNAGDLAIDKVLKMFCATSLLFSPAWKTVL
jgi:hypothetical protein